METRMCGACGRPIVDGAPFFPSEPPIHMYEGGCAAALRAALTAAETALAEERSKREEAEAKLDDAEAAERFAMKYGHEVEKARARADRAEAALEQMRRERDNASEAFHKADTQLTEANRQLAAVRADADCVWFWQGDGHDHPESLACPVVMTADTLRALLRERDEALREAAGVCEEYEAELCRRDPRARVYAAGVGADENAVFTVRDRILALLGEGVGS